MLDELGRQLRKFRADAPSVQNPPARRWLMLCLVAISLLSSPAFSQPQAATVSPEIRVLRAQSDDLVSSPIRTLSARFPDAVISHESSVLFARPGPGLLVTTDAWSLRIACTVAHILPVISIYLPAIEVERASLGCRTKMLTAVFADASPSDQLRVVTDVFGNRSRVLALMPDDAPNARRELESAASNAGIVLVVGAVPDQANVARVLARAPSFDVALAIADSQLYTPANVRTLLEATYRRSVAMVGFSPSAARAGMLASAYATPEDSLDVMNEMIRSYGQAGILPAARHPKTWRLAFNETVARSLSIPIPSDWIAGEPRVSGAPK
jgi:putative tryptophan/tyrosine transport system substrate-binding protein